MKTKNASVQPAVTTGSGAWLLYAGLCGGLRWQRHAARAGSQMTRATPLPAMRARHAPVSVSTRAR